MCRLMFGEAKVSFADACREQMLSGLATSFGSLTWKKVKAISDHVRLAYGKNKRSSSMGITNGKRDRNSLDHQKGGDWCVHTLHTGYPHYNCSYHICVSSLLLKGLETK